MQGADAGGGFVEVLRVALRLGLTSFGGPIAHLGYFQREYVARRRWLDDGAFAELVALCQSLPGPASSQLGMAIGLRRAGIPGALAAWLGFTLPSALVMVAFAAFALGADLGRAGWVAGLKLAAVAVVADAVLRMAARLTPDLPRRLMALLVGAALLLAPGAAAQLAVLAVAAGLGLLLGDRRRTRPAGQPAARGLSPRGGAVSLAAFALLLLALPVLAAVDGRPAALADTFYRSGSLVFGGGHVVLPLLDAGVVRPGWVSEDQFLTGYGLAQALPGPLFSIAAYLGWLSLAGPASAAGAAIALGAIFLPSFLLILGVLPFWERLRASARFRGALDAVSVAVVGLVLAALYDPVATSAVHSALTAGVALGAWLLLALRMPPLLVVALTAAAGQLIGP